MPILKRLAVWLLETLAAAILITVFLAIIWRKPGQTRFLEDLRLMFGLTFVLIMVATGYLLTMALVGVVWRSAIPWVYPMIAATLFILHVQFFVDGWTAKEKFPVQIGGACIVFACCYCGNWFLNRWNEAAASGGSP